MGWLKDWGSYIISALGIIGDLWGYFRHGRKLKSQERIINDMQIRQMRKTEDKECQAEIKAEFVKNSNGPYCVRFTNTGQADASNVRIEFLTPQEELKGVLRNKNWGPYDLINPQTNREEKVLLTVEYPDVMHIKVTWDDSFQKDRTRILSIPL